MQQSGHETVFTLEMTPIKFGPGASDETGWELYRLGVRRALLVSDPGIVRAGITERVRQSIEAAGIACVVYDRVRVEPTVQSLQDAADFAIAEGVDGFVGLGGGSSIDTAKVANLLATHPAPLLDYVNKPIGAARVPPGRLKPLIAIPTTAGTGSEATSVAALEVPEQHVKTGLSNRYLRPDIGIVDPLLTLTMTPEVTSSCGLDALCHAVESYLARDFTSRPIPATPGERPMFQGSTPISDIWAAKTLELGGKYLRRAVQNGQDIEARTQMSLAAMIAGIGFGNAGTHIPHACSYPIAGLKHVYQAPGYPTDHPFVPHGHSVIVTAPSAFRFTYATDPAKHRHAAELLAGRPLPDAGENTLPDVLVQLMKDIEAPRGIAELGYDDSDIDALVEGALKQQRLLVISPREPSPDDLASILRASMANW
jgi:hydroxyacid-oxoacid transhydrogenase